MPEILNAADAAAETTAWVPRSRRYTREALDRMDRTLDLFDRATRGNYHAKAELREALASGDFPITFGQVLDRELLLAYEAVPAVWPLFARRTQVRDFKPKRFVDLLGGQGRLSRVPELTEYPARSLVEDQYQMRVAKFGDRFALSWEAVINDDLDFFRDLPGRLALAARETEDFTATGIVSSATGPNPALFNANAVKGPGYDPAVSTTANTSDNRLAGNPPLTATALQAALTAISTRRDVDGRPVQTRAAVLMIPPALEITARQILTATEIRTTVGATQTTTENFLRNIVTLVRNDWLPVIDTSANVNTTWYLLPAPASTRPTVALGFLLGHETPDLRVKSNTGSRVGGGAIPAEDGSFEIDDIQYRVRHVLGGAGLDAIATASSNGTGVA